MASFKYYKFHDFCIYIWWLYKTLVHKSKYDAIIWVVINITKYCLQNWKKLKYILFFFSVLNFLLLKYNSESLLSLVIKCFKKSCYCIIMYVLICNYKYSWEASLSWKMDYFINWLHKSKTVFKIVIIPPPKWFEPKIILLVKQFLNSKIPCKQPNAFLYSIKYNCTSIELSTVSYEWYNEVFS